jgi:hypothetical protein
MLTASHVLQPGLRSYVAALATDLPELVPEVAKTRSRRPVVRWTRAASLRGWSLLAIVGLMTLQTGR